MTRRPSRIQASRSPGFMLIGVVMFVFVLTILGLSLFTLSGFESQFLYGSSHRAESFYAAAGGIERARFVLTANRPAYEVHNSMPAGVTYTVAKQGTDYATADSTSAINWSSANPVWIRATASVGGQVRTLEQSFDPSLGDSIYERLFTLSGPEGLVVLRYDPTPNTPTHPGDRWPQTELNGLVRTTVPVTGGFNRGSYWHTEVGPVEAPNLDTYYADHWATAQVVTVGGSGDISFTGGLAGGPKGQPRFFKSTGSSQNGWSVDVTASGPDIHVAGTVVWMFEKGIRYNKQVEVHGENSSALLVMVSRPHDSTQYEPRTGLAFHGGFDEDHDNDRCPVILVTDGRVNLEHDENASTSADSYLRYLSVFARNALVMGPEHNHDDQRLRHAVDASQDGPGGVVYELVRRGLLPNTEGGTFTRLEPLAGTWREIAN